MILTEEKADHPTDLAVTENDSFPPMPKKKKNQKYLVTNLWVHLILPTCDNLLANENLISKAKKKVGEPQMM
jgi:hypothetical protein